MHPFIIYSENDGQCGMLANLSPSPPYIFHVSPCCGGGIGRGALLDWRGRGLPDLVVEGRRWAKRDKTDYCPIVVFVQISTNQLTTLLIPAKIGQWTSGPSSPLDQLNSLCPRSSLSCPLRARFPQAAPYGCPNLGPYKGSDSPIKFGI